MNPLQRALVEKTGHDHGFEYVVVAEGMAADAVTLASARHPARAVVRASASGGFTAAMQSTLPTLLPELHRSFGTLGADPQAFAAAGEAQLAVLLRRAASLARALPSQAAQDYQTTVIAELAQLPVGLGGTEVERLVRQRVGQVKFREAMLDYWGGACAVTGVAIPEVLRASHSKPWAECSSDAERLDVFNGFLLSANLDALFDRFLISFSDTGLLLTSPRVSTEVLHQLGMPPSLQLRWLADQHKSYLAFHRERFEKSRNESNSLPHAMAIFVAMRRRQKHVSRLKI